MKILPLAHPVKIDFEAYLTKFEVSTCFKFTKYDCRTIAVTNKRLGTGQRKINASSFCDDPAGFVGHQVKIYVIAHPAMPAEQELKLALQYPAAG